MSTDWRALRTLARGQADLLTRGQCLASGMTDRALSWRVQSGRWERVHPGVFLTRPGRTDWLARANAALLAAEPGLRVGHAALAGHAAAYLHGLEWRPPAEIELVVPYARCVSAPAGTTVRRSLRWAGYVDELAYPWRTTVEATVLDVAGRGSALDGLSVVARAVQREVTTTNLLRQELGRRAGHRHGRLLRMALVDVEHGAQSGAEVLYARDVERAHGLPRGRRQAPSDAGPRRYHDTEYDRFRLLVEVDGRLGHEQWSNRVRDGRRDRQLLTEDRLTTRVFFADVAVNPCQTALEIGAILRSRGWAGQPRRCRRKGCVVARPL